MRLWPFVALLGLLLVLGSAQAQPNGWIQLDTGNDEAAGDAPAAAADMVDLFFGANDTHVFFRQDLAGAPIPLLFSYTVYLDYPRAQGIDPDYRLVHSLIGDYLEQWNGTDWVFVENIIVTTDATNNSVIFEVPFASIGGPGSHMDLWFANYILPPPLNITVDRAPDSKSYKINKRVIPNLPGLVLPVFAGGMVATLVVLRRRFLPP